MLKVPMSGDNTNSLTGNSKTIGQNHANVINPVHYGGSNLSGADGSNATKPAALDDVITHGAAPS